MPLETGYPDPMGLSVQVDNTLSERNRRCTLIWLWGGGGLGSFVAKMREDWRMTSRWRCWMLPDGGAAGPDVCKNFERL